MVEETLPLRIYLLGNPTVCRGDVPIRLETAKTLALLAYLVMRPGPHRRTMLAGMLWGAQDEARAARNLRRALWNLRRAISPDNPAACPYFFISRQEIGFNDQSPFWLDVAEFLRLTQPSPEASPGTQRAQLEEAVRLYRGDFLEGVYLRDAPGFEEWMMGERARLQEEAIQALQRLGSLLTEWGKYTEAIAALRRLLAIAPWLEAAHRQLMLCYALSGQRGAALAQYEQCRQILQEELGVEPLAETTALYQRILRQEIGKETAAAAPGRTELWLPFSGREREHAWLLEQWRRSIAGAGRLTLVAGGAGIGKTRLLEEVLRHVVAQGGQVLRGRCHEFGAQVPYQPIAQALSDLTLNGMWRTLADTWLIELARLLPGLREARPDLPLPTPSGDEAARQRLFEAVARLLKALAERHRSTVLFLDDLHWADQPTLNLLGYLVYALEGYPVWLVGAYRPEDAPLEHPLTRLRFGLGRQGRVQHLQLGPLSNAAVVEIAHALSDDDPLADFLQRESQGNPFFITEVVRGLQEAEVLQPAPGGRWRLAGSLPAGFLPRRVEDMVLQRVARLPPEERWWLTVASIFGQPFTPDLLADVVGEEEARVTACLEACQQRRLIRFLEERRWDFAHDKIRAAVYHHIPTNTRKLLHERVGQTLLDRAGEHVPGEVAAQIAYHFEHSLAPHRAAPFLAQAAEAAREVYAHETAIAYYERLLRLVKGRERARVLIAMGKTWFSGGQSARAEACYRRAVTMARQAGSLQEQAEAWYLLSRAQEHQGNYRASLASAAQAETLALQTEGEHAKRGRALALLAQGWSLFRLGETAPVLDLSQEALTLGEQVGDLHLQADCLNLLSAVYNRMEQYEEGIRCLKAALEMFRAMGNRTGEAQMLNNLGYTAHLQADYAAAIAYYRQALPIAEEIQDQLLVMLCLSNLGGALAAVGEWEEAERCLQRVLAIPEAEGWFLLTETYRYLAEVRLGEGRLEEALEAARQALALAQETGAQEYAGAAWRVLGEVTARLEQTVSIQGHPYDADACFAEGVRVFAEMGLERERERTLRAWERWKRKRASPLTDRSPPPEEGTTPAPPEASSPAYRTRKRS